MTTAIRFILGLILLVLIAPCTNAQQELSVAKTKYWLTAINNTLSGDQLYMQALTYAYASQHSTDVLVDMAEAVIVRKDKCTYTSVKGLVTYSNSEYSLQIDTGMKTITVAQPVAALSNVPDMSVLNNVLSSTMSRVSGNSYRLSMKLKDNDQLQRVDIVFDTLSGRLQKVSLYLPPQAGEIAAEAVSRMDIVYTAVSENIPDQFNPCMARDIIRLNAAREAIIKSESYKQYSVINLLNL